MGQDISPEQKIIKLFTDDLVRVAQAALLRANGHLNAAGLPLRYEVVAHDMSVKEATDGE